MSGSRRNRNQGSMTAQAGAFNKRKCKEKGQGVGEEEEAGFHSKLSELRQ